MEKISANSQECWGKSKLLKNLLLAGKMGNLEVVRKRALKRPLRMTIFSPEQKEFNLWAMCEFDEFGCWNGCKVGKYKVATYRYGKEQLAHRVSWIFTNGEIPKGKCILHHCDNPMCIRPDHLFLGTRTDNNLDKLNKGRQWRPIGVKNPASKLNERIVLRIRSLRKKMLFEREIAEIVGSTRSAVSKVLQGESWRHVK